MTPMTTSMTTRTSYSLKNMGNHCMQVNWRSCWNNLQEVNGQPKTMLLQGLGSNSFSNHKGLHESNPKTSPEEANRHETRAKEDGDYFEDSSVLNQDRLEQKTSKPNGSSANVEERQKKVTTIFCLTKNEKEFYVPSDESCSASVATRQKQKRAVEIKEECTHKSHRRISQTDDMKAFLTHQAVCENCEVNLPGFSNSSAMESTVDNEEDMYRDAEEIEREKVLLVCERGSTENKLSVAPEMDIVEYCQKEWRGNTPVAKLMKKLPEKLLSKYDWIKDWQHRGKLGRKMREIGDEIKEYLGLLRKKWKSVSEMKTPMEKQGACNELFKNEEEEYCLYEAVKFLMLNTAIELYNDNKEGKNVPVFSWLLFARDTSSNPKQLMNNHLNHIGHTGGLEQVEMFLLAYALRHTIKVYRLYKYSTDEFITHYPNDPEEDWPVVTLITEDDRHYNIPVGMCEETAV
ncbi:ubiquitin thioesterase otulin isoform X4 [Alligator mississippiensis]|uniref:ubiquitin thioesterase otulin isoform X4 n=1 Tax=Alligator mississippiensis TaxID=8496 RepID=UPI0028776264|nr:ubiquitin thioesterase otulin isoform X4 [Alligator mississippiensis]